MTNDTIEYETATAETLTAAQIVWVYDSVSTRRERAASRLLVDFAEGRGWPVDHPDAVGSYATARQICAEAWNDGRSTARKRLRVDVQMILPRPSPRVLSSPEERATAMDWQVSATVRDWSVNDDEGAIVMDGDGEVSLYQPTRVRDPEAWTPCRHCLGHESDELAWIHGASLRFVIGRLRGLSPMGIEIARQLAIAISGEGLRSGRADPSGPHPMLIDLDPDGVIPGDIVEHHGSLRVGVVEPGARVCRDRTVEQPIHVFGDERPMQWNSVHIRRLRWDDPYRRYLELRWAADSAGVAVDGQDWARLAIELSGVGMPGEATATGRKIALVNPKDARAIRLARAHWRAASAECTRRVESAAATTLPSLEGSAISSPES